jgi:hypothetical protein
MKLEKRTLTGREKDEAAIQLLEKLREQLYSPNLNVVRQTAYHLSWLQEDGLEILKEALFSNATRRTKNAATYGLRKMRGRMTKPALLLIKAGTESTNSATTQACRNAIDILFNRRPKSPRRHPSQNRRPGSRFEIRDIPARGQRGNVSQPRVRRLVSHDPPRRS